MVALGQIALGRLALRLFDEAGDPIAAGRAVERRAAPDIAETGLRRLGPHAEGDQRPRPCRRRARVHRFVERLDLADDMVRGQHQHERVPVSVAENESGRGRRRRRVAAFRFDQDRLRPDADLPELLGDEEAVRRVANHKR